MSGAIEFNIDEPVFAGEDKTLEYEIFAEDQDPESPNALMEDVSAMALQFALRRAPRRIDPHRQLFGAVLVSKASGIGISVVGTFNPDRALNTQRVRVVLLASDTADFDAGLYVHALKRADVGDGNVLTFGTLRLYKAA